MLNGTSRNSNRSMDHVTRQSGSGSENNSMRFFVSRHLVPPPPPPPSSSTTSSSSSSRPILDSLIWTTSGSTSAGTTYGISQVSNNNNNNSSPSSTSSNNTMSQVNNSTSSAQPVINGSSKTRIDYHSMFIPSSGNNHQRKMVSNRPNGGTMSTGTQAGGHLLQAPRDRKPLSPEYEIPSVSSRASSSCGPFGGGDPLHGQRLSQQQKQQLASSHLNNQQESKCVNSSYNVNYGLNHQDEDRDLLGDEIIGHNQIGQPLNVMTTSGVAVDLMMATPEAVRSGSDLSRLSPSSNSMNHDVIMIGSDHESSPEHECKSNQSESHIYSHIYDPSSCSCPSCDRLNNASSRTKIMYPTTSHHTSHHLQQLSHDLTSSSVLRSTNTGFGAGGRHNQPVLTLPSYHDKLNKKKGKKSGNKQQTQHNISLATLHKLNNLKSSSPDFLSHHNLPPPYLQGLSDPHLHLSQLNPYSTTYNLPSISPIVIEYAKDRRKKCLVLSAALALLVLLILLLVTSFVVFIISSYQSYYSANAVAATFTGTSTQLPPPFAGLDGTSSSTYSPFSDGPINNVFDPSAASPSADPNRFLIPNHQPNPSTVSPSTAQPAQVSSTMAFNEPPNPVAVVPSEDPQLLPPFHEDDCEGGEFKCGDGLCLPKDKRCDGHFNCFDHSDEHDCDPCPTFDGYFHCGNNTSCLPPSKKCDGVYNCWDGADEHGCDSYVHDGYSI